MDKQNKIALLFEALDKRFNKNDLAGWLKRPVRRFLVAKKEVLQEAGLPKATLDLISAKTHTKEDLLILACIPFLKKEFFQAFRDFLSEEVRKILDVLVWEKSLHQDEIEERFNITIYSDHSQTYPSGYVQKRTFLDPQFKLLEMGRRYFHWHIHQEFSLQLLPELRSVLVDYYEPPEGKELKALTEVEETDFLYADSEQDILLEFPRLLAYTWQDQIKTTTKNKPVLSTLGKMRRKLNLKEFYPDSPEKELKTVRTNLLAGLLVTLPRPKKEIAAPLLIKMLIHSYYRDHYFSLLNIISYLKGTGYLEPYYFKPIEPVFLSILQALPAGEWISIDNIEKHIRYNILDVNAITIAKAQEKLYYVYEDKDLTDRYYYDDKHYITENRYYRSLILPLIKGTFYLFASFGLLDIAYNKVDTSIMGKTCESPYDGLRYVRLTNLGAYVSGLLPEYEPPESLNNSSITLSKDSLTIIAEENDATAAVILEPYTVKVSPNRYRTDFAFFLKDCKNKKDLNDKINLFKQAVKGDLPPNWQQFFKELEGKINPLETISDLKIYKIPAESSTLIRLIARDAQLKKLCIKAEGFYVLVEKNKVSQFKKRLQEFGYLLT